MRTYALRIVAGLALAVSLIVLLYAAFTAVQAPTVKNIQKQLVADTITKQLAPHYTAIDPKTMVIQAMTTDGDKWVVAKVRPSSQSDKIVKVIMEVSGDTLYITNHSVNRFSAQDFKNVPNTLVDKANAL